MPALLNFSSKVSAAVSSMTDIDSRNRLFVLTVHELVVGLIFSFVTATLWAQQSTTFDLNVPSTATLNAPTNTSPSAPIRKPALISQAWQKLNPEQKQALAPLGAQWGALTPQQQNKWLAISQNFTRLSIADQVTMHTRMADWVALSPRQRNLARLNFKKLQGLAKEDKKSKWEAYQALSDEEKRVLSKKSSPPPKSAARTAQPQGSERLMTSPLRPKAKNHKPSSAINRKTLLPNPPEDAVPASPTSRTIQLPSTSDNTRPAAETSPS